MFDFDIKAEIYAKLQQDDRLSGYFVIVMGLVLADLDN